MPGPGGGRRRRLLRRCGRDDVIFSTHRPVGHLLAKGASLAAITAEIWGKATGCAGGKGGQMHLVDVAVGAMPSNAIVGANIPIATGAAIGFKLRGLDRVAVSFFGDGAANIGAFHEGINLAAVKDAPVVFVCENNLYAASTHVSLTTRIADIADRAAAYGIPGVVVDGMDVDRRLPLPRRRPSSGPGRRRADPARVQDLSLRRPLARRPGQLPRRKKSWRHWRGTRPDRRLPRACSRESSACRESALDEIERECQADGRGGGRASPWRAPSRRRPTARSTSSPSGGDAP